MPGALIAGPTSRLALAKSWLMLLTDGASEAASEALESSVETLVSDAAVVGGARFRPTVCVFVRLVPATGVLASSSAEQKHRY